MTYSPLYIHLRGSVFSEAEATVIVGGCRLAPLLLIIPGS